MHGLSRRELESPLKQTGAGLSHDLPLLEVSNVSKRFEGDEGAIEALTNVSMTAWPGEFVSIVGPSGCGKSTLLEIIAGLQRPTSGRVSMAGMATTMQTSAVGYMPQKDLLLPWRSILDNTILGLEVAGSSKRRARQAAIGWFERFGLAGFEHHYPATLSGGMRQRAALLRTFLSGREMLVLDEPFGALDALTRMQMQEWLLGIQDEFHKTIVLVTHDVDEALYLSDRVYVMTARPGSISGTCEVPFGRPRRYEETVTSPPFTALKRSLLERLKHSSPRAGS